MTDEVWPGMPRPEWARAQSYLRVVQQQLRLGDWEIVLAETPTDDSGNGAEIFTTPKRRLAVVKLNEAWARRTTEQKRHTVVHELMHCLTNPITTLLRVGSLSELLGRPAFTVLYDAVDLVEEQVVDGLANALTAFMPPYPPEAVAAE